MAFEEDKQFLTQLRESKMSARDIDIKMAEFRAERPNRKKVALDKKNKQILEEMKSHRKADDGAKIEVSADVKDARLSESKEKMERDPNVKVKQLKRKPHRDEEKLDEELKKAAGNKRGQGKGKQDKKSNVDQMKERLKSQTKAAENKRIEEERARMARADEEKKEEDEEDKQFETHLRKSKMSEQDI